MKFWPLIIVVLLGLFLRAYQPLERFIYAHDSDLASWMIKDMLVDGHLRLIGQQTSESGIFIGPLFYYLLTPFYLLNNFDPAFSLLYSWIIGILSIFSLYYVVIKIHGKKPALISALIYAVSFAIVYTEREVVPTTPVMLWTIWAYYAINRQKIYLIAVLLALVWHINLALVLLAPIFLISVFRKLNFTNIIKSIIIFLLISTPLIFFEFRHNFQQSKALIGSLTSAESKSSPNYLHTLTYASKNLNKIFYYENHWPQFILLIILILAAGLLTVTKKVSNYFFILVVFWQLLFIMFFSLHTINLSEYYLNGMNIIWIIIAGLLLSHLPSLILLPLILVFMYSNIELLLIQQVNKVGYIQKKLLVSFIKSDAQENNYPCVSVSYMTNPGYELGYRYFFYLSGLHVNQPKSGSPVYTIVFPHSRANKIDESFGALGLIKPDYSKYTEKEVKLTCAGQNSNLTDPMFGFTK